MIPFEKIAETRTGDHQVLELRQRGEHFFLCCDRVPLAASDSEQCELHLALDGCRPLTPKRQPRVLLDGLGLGSTLRSALAVLPKRSSVEVAEPLEAMILWQRGPLVALHGRDLLADDRVSVCRMPFANCLEARSGYYDAVLLDLDFAVAPYLSPRRGGQECEAALNQLTASLRCGGRLVFRSESPESAAFRKGLQRRGFHLSERFVHPNGKEKGRKHAILSAVLPHESHA